MAGHIVIVTPIVKQFPALLGVCLAALVPYLAGEWSVQQISEEHKKHLITQLIPSMLTTYHNLHADTGTKTKANPLSED